jgi:hypothetical protein
MRRRPPERPGKPLCFARSLAVPLALPASHGQIGPPPSSFIPMLREPAIFLA